MKAIFLIRALLIFFCNCGHCDFVVNYFLYKFIKNSGNIGKQTNKHTICIRFATKITLS